MFGLGADSTTVVAAVYGPKSVGGWKENPERATIEVIWKPKSGQAGEFLLSLHPTTLPKCSGYKIMNSQDLHW